MTLENDCVDVNSELIRDTTCVCSCEPYTVKTTVTSEGGIFIIERGVYLDTIYNPELTGIKYESGDGTGTFTSQFSGLEDNTTYYVKGYALLSSGKQILGNRIIISTVGTVTDIEGNVYNTTSIGDQVWMSYNLRTSLYNDGSPIRLVSDGETWAYLTEDAYCLYDNSPANKAFYGALYNFYAVNTGKLCPTGWHVPSWTELLTMISFLQTNGFNFDGSIPECYAVNKLAKALSVPPSYWHLIWYFSGGNPGSPIRTDYPEKINSTCFSAVPGGYRHSIWGFGFENGHFWHLGEVAFYWTSTISSVHLKTADNFEIFGSDSAVELGYGYGDFSFGYSVRCIKDQ
jgi:uncharacterized protein (TIGR02145 family)